MLGFESQKQIGTYVNFNYNNEPKELLNILVNAATLCIRNWTVF